MVRKKSQAFENQILPLNHNLQVLEVHQLVHYWTWSLRTGASSEDGHGLLKSTPLVPWYG